MAIGDILTIKGEEATVLAETNLQRHPKGVNSAQLLQLTDSKMYVVIRNGFIQTFGINVNATFDLAFAKAEYVVIVNEFLAAL